MPGRDYTCRFYLLQILLASDSTWCRFYLVHAFLCSMFHSRTTAESGLEMQKLVLKEPDTCSHSNNADKSL